MSDKSKKERMDSARKEFYREVDIVLDKIRPPSAFRHSTVGQKTAAVLEKGRMSNALVSRLPILLERYTQMVNTQQARPVYYTSEGLMKRINEILNFHGHSEECLRRELLRWISDLQERPNNGDIAEDKMTEGWES